MAQGATYQLSLLLTLQDRMTRGLKQGIATLRAVSKTEKDTTQATKTLQRELSKPVSPGRGTAKLASDMKRVAGETKAATKTHEQFRREAEKPIKTSQVRDGRGRFVKGAGTSAANQGGRADRKLTDDLRADLAAGAGGYAAVRFYRGGLDAASDYEQAMLSLRSAYQETGGAANRSAQQQEKDLSSLGALAKSLGNDLQGSTSDYAAILTALKQGGLEVETVLGGAGKAASYLANVSGAITAGNAAEQAKDLAQFGKIYKLQAKDFESQVNLFSSLKDRFDIDSSSIVESSKYFAPTANALKMTGIGGAGETAKLFAYLKRYGGLEGSQAGTSATSFFQQFIAQKDKRDDLQKETGLKFNLFDQKGEFLGLENAFKELEKLRKFSSETRLEILNNIYGEQGGKVAGAMVEGGVEGWRGITTESNKAVAVNQKINQQMATYAAKLEALSGSYENLKAGAFTPAIDFLKPRIDSANKLVGIIQDFAAEHPKVALVGTSIIGVGGAVLMATAAIGGLRTVTGLWRVAAALASKDTAQAIRNATSARAAVAGQMPLPGMTTVGVQGIGQATGRLGKFRAALGSIPKTIGVTLAVIGVEQAIESGINWYHELGNARKAIAGEEKATASLTKSLRTLAAENKGMLPEETVKGSGSSALQVLNLGGLKEILQGQSFGRRAQNFNPFAPLNPFGSNSRFGGASRFNPQNAVQEMKTRTPELGMPQIMRDFQQTIRSLVETRKYTPEQGQKVLDAARTAFPESYRVALSGSTEAMQRMMSESNNVANSLQGVSLSLDTVMPALSNLVQPSNALAPSLTSGANGATSFANAATNAAARINSIEVKTITVPVQQAAPQAVPSRAIGGDVVKSGFVNVHAGEKIVPAQVSFGLRDGSKSNNDAGVSLARLKAIEFEPTQPTVLRQRQPQTPAPVQTVASSIPSYVGGNDVSHITNVRNIRNEAGLPAQSLIGTQNGDGRSDSTMMLETIRMNRAVQAEALARASQERGGASVSFGDIHIHGAPTDAPEDFARRFKREAQIRMERV